MNIKLQYFKQTGKYYSSGVISNLPEHLEHYEIIGHIRILAITNNLPGLNSDSSEPTELTIYVSDQQNTMTPAIIFPEK